MPASRVWAKLLGVEQTVVEDIDLDADQQVLVAHVRPAARQRRRCGTCQRRCPLYDPGRRRRWRGLDLGFTVVWLEAQAPRVRCKAHGVVVAAVPWARHGAGHTSCFDQQVAWLVTKCSKSAVSQLMRVSWRSVGKILQREYQDLDAGRERLAGLSKIGIDEVSYKKGHRYLIVVVDHDTGYLVWAKEGRDKATVRAFFDELGEQRCRQITHVSADGANWLNDAISEAVPGAVICADPFHVVAWATEAVDEYRRQRWREARTEAKNEPKRGPGRPPKNPDQQQGASTKPKTATEQARTVKGARYPLLKNPENLTDHQQSTLEWIQISDPKLHRAYLLKEKLRLIFQLKDVDAAEAELDSWLSWARRSRLSEFVKLARSITRHRHRILASIHHGLNNGRVESMNTKIRLITRVAFGFHSANSLIAMAMLTLSGLNPQLPGRA